MIYGRVPTASGESTLARRQRVYGVKSPDSVHECRSNSNTTGGASLSDAPNSEFGELSPPMLATIRDFLEGARGENRAADLRFVRDVWHVWLAGFDNRRVESVIDVFRRIAETAPGSYGLLYTYEWWGEEEGWTAWVMARGRVRPEADPFLAPHVGVVEDPWQFE